MMKKMSEENAKFWRGGGISDFGIRRAWGDEHFGISEDKGGLKYSCPRWYGMDIIWNHLMEMLTIFIHQLKYSNQLSVTVFVYDKPGINRQHTIVLIFVLPA